MSVLYLPGDSGGEDAHDAHDTHDAQAAVEEPNKKVAKKRKLQTQEPDKVKKKKTVQATHTDINSVFVFCVDLHIHLCHELLDPWITRHGGKKLGVEM